MVVVGVLIALWASEWAERRQRAADDAVVLRDVHEEVAYNMLVMAGFKGTDRCSAERLAEIRERLETSSGQWPGESDYVAQGEGSIYPMMIRMRGGTPQREQYQRAILSGAIERSPDNGALRELYYSFGLYADAREEFTALQPRLSVLTRPATLDNRQRLALLEVVAQLDWALHSMRQTADFAYNSLPDSFVVDAARVQDQVDDFAELARSERGDCVVDIDARTGEPKA